jgi:cell division protein FtsB
MARRLKSTPFARFLLAMLIIIPLAYFGAAYYNGEDPVEKIKDTLGIEENKVVQVEDNERVSADAEDSYDLRQEIEQLKERIRDLEEENQLLKEKVHELQMRE